MGRGQEERGREEKVYQIIASCLACVYRDMNAREKFEEHEREYKELLEATVES